MTNIGDTTTKKAKPYGLAFYSSINWNLLDNPCKKLAHQLSNLRVVTLKSKVTAGNEVYLSIGQVVLEGFGTGWNERRVINST